MIERAQLRSRVYAVLSIAFSPPREAMGAPGVLQAAVLILREVMRVLAVPVPARTLLALEEGERQVTSNPGQGGGDELEAEYNRLFVGPGAPRVYPYESLYRDSTGLVMGPSTGKVHQAYRRSGLEMSSAYRDLPDHLAVELEFMARLCGEEAKARSAGRTDLALRLKEEQRSFLAEHLAPWLPRLCERVIRGTSSPIYRGLAEVAAIFVGWDREQVGADQPGGMGAVA